MSQGYTDRYREAGAYLRPPRTDSGPSTVLPARPTFADLLDLVRHPKGILSVEEHHFLRDHVRSVVGLPPVEPDEEDEEIVDVEVHP